jgi:RNA polymerase sigma factor (TIGR02999 family)
MVEDLPPAALFQQLYTELHRLARQQMRQHGGGVSLSATTLLHKAYLDLQQAQGLRFNNQRQFMSYAARAMRGLIVDHARSRKTSKRGAEFEFVELDEAALNTAGFSGEALAELAEALEALSLVDKRLAEVVDLHFFCGLNFGEIAALHEVSERTTQRDWEKARALLHRSLSPAPPC